MATAWPEIVFSGEHDAAALSRAVKRGTLRRLGRGIYSGDLTTDLDDLVPGREIARHADLVSVAHVLEAHRLPGLQAGEEPLLVPAPEGDVTDDPRTTGGRS